MLQQSFALLIIAIFLTRLLRQKQKNKITQNEFVFWFIFWLIASLAIIFLKDLDHLLAYLGFSSSGINFLLYIAVLYLFYFIFRMRLRLVKMEKDITELARNIALKK